MRRIDHLLITRPGRACRAAVAVGLLLASAAPVAEAASRKREESAKTALTAETQVSLGRRFEAKGDTETALGLYQKAVSEKPDNEEALRALIGLAVRTNRASLVLDEAVRLATKRPNDAEAQLWLATALNEKGRPVDALAALAEAEKAGSGPMPALLWAQRGIAHDMACNHLEAQRAFSRAITLNPSDWQLPMRLALSLALQGDYPAALRILQMQVNDPLMERPVRETLAIIYALSGQTEQATEIARTATAAELADSQRGYLALLPTLSAQGKAYAAHFRRINESLPAAAPAAKPAAPAAKVEAVKPEALRSEAPKSEALKQEAPRPVVAAAPIAELAVAEAPKAPQAVSSGTGYWLQLASLVSRDKAHAAWADATGRAGALLGQRQAFVQVHAQGGVTYHRLLTGPFETLAQARDFAARLGAQGIKPVIKRDVGAIEPLKP